MAKNPGHPQTLKPRGEPGPGRPKGSKNKLTRERVEQELRILALTNHAAGMFGGGKRRFTLREISEMSEDMQRCIAGVKVKTENLTPGDNAQDTTVEVKLWDKVKALELCARALGMLKDVHVHEVAPEQLALLDAWKRANRKVDE